MIMAPLTWGDPDPAYAYGVDRGVIHSHATDEILPWNGLIEVTRDEDAPDTSYSVFEGVTYLNTKLGGLYSASVKSFGFPQNMIEGLGYAAVFPGFFLTGQTRTRFDFAYRIMTGESNYKLHFVWNALFSTSGKKHNTLTDDVDLVEHTWKVTATPPRVFFWAPTAFLVVDALTAGPAAMETIEDLLYGTDSTDPEFPTQVQVLLSVL